MKAHVLILPQEHPYAPLLVRVVEWGERYGLDFKLVHDGFVPMVEFYDTRYPFTCYGQFVSRYTLDTILKSKGGINLHGGTPSWVATSPSMEKVRAWLEEVFEASHV